MLGAYLDIYFFDNPAWRILYPVPNYCESKVSAIHKRMISDLCKFLTPYLNISVKGEAKGDKEDNDVDVAANSSFSNDDSEFLEAINNETPLESATKSAIEVDGNFDPETIPHISSMN